MRVFSEVPTLTTLLLLTTSLTAADLPPVSDLPSRPQLPDPLIMLDGTPVTSASQWREQRRPELKRLFQHYMYGHMPPTPPADQMRYEVTHEDKACFAGRATLRLVDIHFPPTGTSPIHLLLVTPNTAKPVPVFLGINFCGNHAVLNDPAIPLSTAWLYDRYPGVKDNRATEASRGTQIDVWNIEKVIARGYAVATFYNGDIDPDFDDFSNGVHPHFKGFDWGTIAAWAWGLHRAVDYLQAAPGVDKSRIAVVGHSRLGKTALLAAAFDERIALAIPSQAGCGGTAPNRNAPSTAETVQRINTVFPHWFNDNFPLFNDQVDKLPFDQHCLMALVAPRPILLSNAAEDLWANPAGQLQLLYAAKPVYDLLDIDKKTPAPIGYFLRPGKHAMTWEDWQAWLDFADLHLPRP